MWLSCNADLYDTSGVTQIQFRVTAYVILVPLPFNYIYSDAGEPTKEIIR